MNSLRGKLFFEISFNGMKRLTLLFGALCAALLGAQPQSWRIIAFTGNILTAQIGDTIYTAKCTDHLSLGNVRAVPQTGGFYHSQVCDAANDLIGRQFPTQMVDEPLPPSQRTKDDDRPPVQNSYSIQFRHDTNVLILDKHYAHRGDIQETFEIISVNGKLFQ